MQFSMPVAPEVYDNPFDPAEIELIGIFQSPQGNQVVIPGFWMQPYTDACQTPCEGYDLRAEGEPVWQIRFTPDAVGRWTYTLQVRDQGAVTAVQDGEFVVAPSDRPGFIRRPGDSRYFQHDNGRSYFPVGGNLNWSWDAVGGLETYLQWLRELSESGGNYARLYIDVPWFINLEWAGPAGDYRAAQKQAAELDIILEQAAEYGIYLQVVLLWHQSLRTYTSPPVVLPERFERPDVSLDWDNHPYNVLNGGPLSGPSVFFFNEQAQNLFRRRLRYIAARWGFSPQIFAWEIIDQIDRTANYTPAVAGAWLQSAANYLRQIDQRRHLITAGSREQDPVITENPFLDFASGGFYQRRPIETVGDQVLHVVRIVERSLQPPSVPFLLTRFSLNPWFEPTADDPSGVHVHNTLWAAALAGMPGGGVSEWWDTYVLPQNLTRFLGPLAAFAADVDWATLDLQPASAALLSDDLSSYQPVRVDQFRRQFAVRAENVVAHTITADGVFPDLTDVPSFLYGQVYNTQFSQAQIYRVVLPVDTYLRIGIRAVSSQARARLVVQVDGVTTVQLELRADSRDAAVLIPLRAGEHTITLDNLGDDWLELDSIEIGHLRVPARVLTLRDSAAGVALAWLQHREYTWEQAAAGHEPEAVLFTYRLDAMPAGRYRVEIWDTFTGAVVGEEIVRVEEDGLLAVELLPLRSQLALRAFLHQEPEEVPLQEQTEPAETPTDQPTPFVPLTETEAATMTPQYTPTATATPVRRETSLPTLVPFVAFTNTPRAASTVTLEPEGM
jgi:hypothetical protein